MRDGFLEQLRREVKDSELSLWELSKRTGIKVNTISAFVRRGKDIRQATARKLMNELGLVCELSHAPRGGQGGG